MMFSRQAISRQAIVFGVLPLILTIGAWSNLAQAQSTYWQHDPATPGDWFEPTNWTAGVPTSTDDAWIENGGTAWIGESMTASASRMFVQSADTSTVLQTAGSEAEFYHLFLGKDSGTVGVYKLNGGHLNVVSETFVGANPESTGGTGLFQQSGGTNTCEYLSVGGHKGSEGTYEISGDSSLDVRILGIGHEGTGTFVQNGGDVVGEAVQLAGTYELHAGTLSMWRQVGFYYQQLGTFIQTGGSVSTAKLYLNSKAGECTYTISGGEVLTLTKLSTGGRFIQNGGTVTALGQGVELSGPSSWENTYEISGASVLQAAQIAVNQSGEFFQMGGEVTVTGTVIVGNLGTNCLYEISGGSLTAETICVGSDSGTEGHLVQRNGVVTASSALVLGDRSGSTGVYTISAGQLVSSQIYIGKSGLGTLEMANSSVSVTVSELLHLGFCGSLLAVPGTTIHMTGAAFENQGSLPEASADMKNIRMVFEGGTADVDPFEVAGEDMGAVPAGLESNFALGTLQLGGADIGQVQLVSNFDNQPGWAGSEALYVENLILGAGSTLDMNGLNLYYLTFTDHGGTILNGTPTLIPEPATLLLLGFGVILVLTRRRMSVGQHCFLRHGRKRFATGTRPKRLGDQELRAMRAGRLVAKSGLRLRGIGLVALMFVAILSASAQGTDTYWQHDPATPGDWFDPANWTPIVPTSSDTGYIDNGGTAQISTGDATIGDFYLGQTGSGTVVQVGGTNTIGGFTYLGHQPGASGTYMLSNGQLYTHTVEVGYSGMGLFILEPGAEHTAVTIRTHNGGVYEVRGGSLSAERFNVMGGICRQSGGSVSVASSWWSATALCVRASLGGSNTGIYELTGGFLTAEEEHIGEYGAGEFRHTSGVNSASSIYIGQGNGTYELSGSGVISADYIGIGVGGTGVFKQNGGSVYVEQYLILGGYDWGPSNGRYELNDGNLTVNKAYIGSKTIGVFCQTGGTLEILDKLCFATGSSSLADGTFTISGGTLVVENLLVEPRITSGTFNIAGPLASITVGNRLQFGSKSVFTAVPGATIHMTGSAFENESADPAALAGLRNLRLIFEGGTVDVDPFEVAGEDKGAVMEGLEDNFALGTLQLGGDAGVGQVQLVSNFDNRPDWVGTEALYVENLILGAGSTLDLNGLNLYYLTFTDEGGTILNGTPTLIPEPATMTLLALGACLPLLRKRK